MTYWEMPYPQSREHLAELQEIVRRNQEKAPTKPATVPPPAPKKDSEAAAKLGWYVTPDGWIYTQP